MSSCNAKACRRVAVARGLCPMHWKRWRKHGDPNYQRKLFDLWAHVRKRGVNQCWPYTGKRHGKGRGRVWYKSRHWAPSQLAYMLTKGKLPKLRGADYRGTCVTHSCDNHICCNPRHLHARTHRQNMQEAVKRKRTVAFKKRCLRGHPRNGKNTWIDPKTRLKHCRVCNKLRMRRVYAQRRVNLR